jgi:hypothetical protein
MNTRAILWGALAATLVASPKAIAGGQGGSGGIPLPVGQFSITVQGSLASCVNSGGTAEPCNTSGVVVVPLGLAEAGIVIRDQTGNACSSHTSVASTVPVGAAPPTVLMQNTKIALINYDPMTGTGDASFAEYVGGACKGATFDATGATQTTSGTLHFVVTEDGNRIDEIITSVSSVPGPSSFGGFLGTLTELRQTTP